MKFLKKLNNHKQHAGLERRILKNIPKWYLGSIVAPLFVSLMARVFSRNLDSPAAAKYISSVDIFSIAIAATAWIGLFTLTIGCIIVVIMKGPAYVADAYELPDFDEPASSRKKNEKDYYYH